MPSVQTFFLALGQAALLLFLAPLISGFSRVLRAKMHSRKGPPLLQDYYDIFKLLKRQEIMPKGAGLIVRDIWQLRENRLEQGCCPHCGAAIAGRWQV